MTAPTAKNLQLRRRAEAVIPAACTDTNRWRHYRTTIRNSSRAARGSYLWDVDGSRYLDLMCAYGPQLFGYAHAAIDDAAIERIRQGDPLTGPTEYMVSFAERMTALVTHAQWAMFCKNGTDATPWPWSRRAPIPAARPWFLAKGAYHGAAPWCTPRTTGTTPEDRANQLFCHYNDIESLEAAVARAGDDLAAIFASPFKHDALVDQALPDSRLCTPGPRALR